MVPPEGWKPRTAGYETHDEIVLDTPIRQEAMGKAGMYGVLMMQQKPMTIAQYRELAQKPENGPPPLETEDPDRWELEKKYWQGFAGKPPVYGSDNHSKTLFEECSGAWNLSTLDTVLRRKLNVVMGGINSPMLYMGMWRASFAWHVEDCDLYSINYLHYGADKVWYCAAAEHGKKLERIAAGHFPDQARNCPQFLRHKSTIISPSIVVGGGVPLTRVVHRAGEFVIALPYAYHSG